jgi:hypothetical protein
MLIKNILTEQPLKDFEPIGDFDKSSSFRDKRDRTMIKNPRFKEIMTKKFKNTNYDINMYFVNSPAANKHTEVGGVSLEWVRENLGDEVADKVEPNYQEDSQVNIIFTNNKGSERLNMTPWIIAHRMGHAFGANNGRGMGSQYRSYDEIVEAISREFKMIFHDVYGIKRFSSNKKGPTDRESQLLMKHLAHNICTFKSARDKNLRDYFELYNELFAQHMINGRIRFNELPLRFKAGSDIISVRDKEAYEELKDLDSLANTLEYYFDEMLGEAEQHVLVM